MDTTIDSTPGEAAGQPERRVYIKTYGCQMNVYDSGRMAESLGRHGFQPTEAAEDADLIILNTCHIREKAAEKVYSEIGKLKGLKAERQGVRIAVTGCVAQAEGQEIVRRAPAVDLVMGPQTYHRLPEFLARLDLGDRHLIEADLSAESKFEAYDKSRARPVSAQVPSAFLTVQEGCDKFCTFCVVPYTRGTEVSRPVAKIAAEARRLVEGGAREITLLGQNVNGFRGEGPDGKLWSLGRLLRHLAEIEDLKRLRYTTSHPRDMDEELIAAHRDVPILMPYLHLPVQSGSDRVLKAMNRRHTAAEYRALINRIREARPDIALSSDFIVGFPGETEDDFLQTLDLVSRVGFAQSYSFKYSPRPGTPAAERSDQVSEADKARRLTQLQTLLETQHVAFNDACHGRECEVLIERPGREPGHMLGRTPYLQACRVDGKRATIGDMVKVRIESVGAHVLTGHIMATERDDSLPRISGGMTV